MLAIVLKDLFLVLAAFGLAADGSSESEGQPEKLGLATVIVIRHAEKDVGDDPSLTEKGQKRAKELVHVLEQAGIKAIYAAKVKRAQQTAQPLQASLKLAKLFDASQSPAALAGEVRERYAGQTVLIIGQVPTIPGILKAFGVTTDEVREAVSSYDSMFILQLSSQGKCKLLKLKYGERSQ